MSPQIAAIVLAAGRSRRMGQPKMLLPLGRTTVLGQVLTAFGGAGIHEIVVVTGAEREKVEGLVAALTGNLPVRCIFNPAYESGEMLSSLQCGLAGLGPGVDAALVGLGDQPRVETRSVRSIVAAFEASHARIVVPSFEMRRGHPWLVERSLWAGLAALQPSQTPRTFLDAHASEIHYVNMDTPTVLEDLDTPEDYQRLIRD